VAKSPSVTPIPFGHADPLGARLGPELGEHVRGQVDPLHPDTAPAERDGDPPGADAELEGGPVPGQAGQEVHHRVDRRRLEQLRPPGLVALGDPLVEVVRGHGRQHPRRPRPTAIQLSWRGGQRR
jgi:hypothetical protein